MENKGLTVGFDLTWMDSNNKIGGVFQYALRLITALVEHGNASVIAIIGTTGKGIFDHLRGFGNFREILLEPPASLSDVIKAEQIRVVHSPVQSFQHLTLAAPMISTLHDLQHCHYPEFFHPEEIRFRDIFYRYSAEFSERVIVSYEHVKQDIVQFYGIRADKIDICPPGTVVPRMAAVDAFGETRRKYRLPNRYLFYPANTWRHKNHVNLIKALKILHTKYGLKMSLVCTGYKFPDVYPEIKRQVRNLRLDSAVYFTGYIPEEDVNSLLRHSSLVIIPTLYEAGSFPLLDAMSHGVPVICSNVTSLPNTIGDKRFVFDPLDVEDIAEKAAMLLKDANLMDENRSNSRQRLANSGWHNAVQCFIHSYSKALGCAYRNKDAGYQRDKTNLYERLMNHYLDWQRNLNNQRQKELADLRGSLSWKMTAPLRDLKDFYRHFKKNTGKPFPGHEQD